MVIDIFLVYQNFEHHYILIHVRNRILQCLVYLYIVKFETPLEWSFLQGWRLTKIDHKNQYLSVFSKFKIAFDLEGILTKLETFNSPVLQNLIFIELFYEISNPNLLFLEFEFDVLIENKRQCY